MKIIVWDFNGTLLNDVQASFDAFNELCVKYHIPIIETIEEYRHRFSFPVINLYEEQGFDISNYDVLSIDYVEHFYQKIPTIPLHHDAYTVLNKTKELGYTNILISATQHSVLNQLVDYYALTPYFSLVLGTSNNDGNSKLDVVSSWFHRSTIQPQDIVFIGDSLHDATCADHINSSAILISHGHQSETVLKESNYTIASSLMDVLNYLI